MGQDCRFWVENEKDAELNQLRQMREEVALELARASTLLSELAAEHPEAEEVERVIQAVRRRIGGKSFRG